MSTSTARLFRFGSAALVAAAALGACAAPAPGPQQNATQQLQFGSCGGYAKTAADEKLFAAGAAYQCARMTVPLDYDHPEAGTGQIAMLRVPARGRSQGTLVLNSGGPGGTGMNFAATTAAALAHSPVTERFDLVGFDPRGVGASTPAARCFTTQQYLAGDTRTEFFFSARSWSAEDARRLAGQCAAGSGGEPALKSFASRDTVLDLDRLRAALGPEKLTFLGQSYGTRIGALYAAAFPQHVRAMVLDGAVDPQAGAERRLAQYTGFQATFEKMAADCAARPDCALGPDPARATDRFQTIVRPLLDRPVPYGNGRQLTYDDAINAVVGALYHKESWPGISKGLTELQSGNPARFAQINQLYSGREPDGRGSDFDSANLAITCMDEQRMSPEQAAGFRDRIHRAAPFADPGRGSAGARDACEAWPVAPKPTYPFPDRVAGLPPTLTISLTDDPATPYDGAERMARALGGRLLAVDGDGHTLASSGTNACVNDAVAAYLTTVQAPPAGTRCSS
ncbi:alpha/beta hydrolase [Amycolatopsis sp. PS_44_ISF1]|uniref:alpha/beta hydrolase n=1 Tax=Amycolatopsis sp. PS_44_ISF1 TaxID=2974917 RepID=UPI0028DE42A7|nr:alpha/beta hydrolase [Amycolatopsis sp. PS_44_ISF1]MDT8914678.1 alpha/beta hydrolase [Amycolatopsis sp. PS_44_ISF1]